MGSMQEAMRGRKDGFQGTGMVNSGGVRVWEMKSPHCFFGSVPPKELEHHQVKMSKEDLALLLWSSERDLLVAETWGL